MYLSSRKQRAIPPLDAAVDVSVTCRTVPRSPPFKGDPHEAFLFAGRVLTVAAYRSARGRTFLHAAQGRPQDEEGRIGRGFRSRERQGLCAGAAARQRR